jgi:asparagine synthase (glutamine-hydrolysing)
MVSSDGGFVLVYNGECYNYGELRKRNILKDIKWRSSSDAEVVLELFARRGQAALNDLSGIYAAGVWNEREREFFLFRDRLGIKPVYYAMPAPEVFVFASEVRAILASGLLERRVSPEGLRSYLAYGFVQCPLTIAEGIKELPPAHLLSLDENFQVMLKRYWSPPFPQNGSLLPLKKERPDQIRESFLKAIKSQIVGDVPLGIFLSGGADSGALVCGLAHLGVSQCQTVTVSFPDYKHLDEGPEAAELASVMGCEHQEVSLSGSDMEKLLPETMRAQDQPSCDAVNTYIVSKAAREAGLTVALSGLGGDELFAGYGDFQRVPEALKWRKRLSLLSPILSGLLPRLSENGKKHQKIGELFRRPISLVEAFLAARRLFASFQIDEILSGANGSRWQKVSSENLRELDSQTSLLDPRDGVSLCLLSTYTQSQLLRDCDVMGMSHSMEIRVPFLDDCFAQEVIKMGPAVRTYTGGKKTAFLQALAGIVPPTLGDKRKMGFTLPFEKWTREEMSQNIEGVLNFLGSTNHSLFSQEGIKKLWRDFTAKPEKVGWPRVWALYSLGTYFYENKLDFTE